MTRAWIASIVVGLVVVGCSKEPADSPVAGKSAESAKTSETSTQSTDGKMISQSKSMPVGSGKSRVSASNFSLSAPPDWKAIDLTSKDLEKILAGLANDPVGSKMVTAVRQAAASGMIKLFVFGPGENGFARNFNVVQVDQPRELTLDEVKDADSKELEPIVASPVAFKNVKLPSGDALQYESTLKMKAPNGSALTSIGYAISRGKQVTTLTFTCMSKDAASMEKTAEQVVNSFEVH